MGGNVEMLIYGLEVRFFCIFFAKKFAKYNLFIVSLQRRSEARKRDVRSANEMRSFFEGCLMLNV